MAIKWGRKQILSLACKCIEHESSLSLVNVMRCWLKFLCFFLFIWYCSMAITACPPVSNGTKRNLSAEWESIVHHLHNQIYDFTDNLFRHIKNNIIFIFLFSAFDFHWNMLCTSAHLMWAYVLYISVSI